MKFTKIDDYVDKVAEKFPTIPKKSIRKILEFGSRSFYANTYYGGDVLLKSPYFTLYCGRVFKDNLLFYSYWKLKFKIKYRILYARRKTQYDGYYYFGLSENEYEIYKKQLKSKTKRRQKITFDTIYIYKILDECILHRHHIHFFKIPVKTDGKFCIKLTDFTTRDFEYLGKRSGDQSIEYIDYDKRSK